MIIFWKGYGILVLFIGGLAVAITSWTAEYFTGEKNYEVKHGWVFLIAMLGAAAVTYGLHKLILREKQRVVVDKDTGEEVVLASEHSLMFVPVKWWPGIFIVLGIFFTVVEQTKTPSNGAANRSQQVVPERTGGEDSSRIRRVVFESDTTSADGTESKASENLEEAMKQLNQMP